MDNVEKPSPAKPKHLDLKKDHGLTIEWSDGKSSFFPIEYLRRMSPSADQRLLREEMAKNPLTVLPARPANDGPLIATDAQMVGNYAIGITFSDGHDTGIYSFTFLRRICQCDVCQPVKPDQPKGRRLL